MTSEPLSVVAYVGYSISIDEARAALPFVEIRGPVRRGDLYAAREAGASMFLIVDGVFMQNEAISPREVVDVLRDGAAVYGASSMGALRAAECWPAGAIGIGLIYRLFRLGWLESDEEVACVAARQVSVPLVNVRYAASRARRAKLLQTPDAERLVDVASAIYYPDRSWPAIFSNASWITSEQRQFCAALDLKRRDAERAVQHLRARIADAELRARHSRRSQHRFGRSEQTREPPADPTFGRRREELEEELLLWLLGSGRLLRHLLPIIAAPTPLGGRWSSDNPHARFGAGLMDALGRFPEFDEPASRQTVLRGVIDQALIPLALDARAFANAVWNELECSSELDSELMHFQALRAALAEAERLSLRPTSVDRARARRQIAAQHGFPSWALLAGSARARRFSASIEQCAEELAVAKCVRRRWFSID